MSKAYLKMIANKVTDMGWSCDYCPAATPRDGALSSAYAEKNAGKGQNKRAVSENITYLNISNDLFGYLEDSFVAVRINFEFSLLRTPSI